MFLAASILIFLLYKFEGTAEGEVKVVGTQH